MQPLKFSERFDLRHFGVCPTVSNSSNTTANIRHQFKKTTIDIEWCKNRLLKFCYVPATSTAHNRLLFFAAAVNSTNEENTCC